MPRERLPKMKLETKVVQNEHGNQIPHPKITYNHKITIPHPKITYNQNPT